MAPRILPVLLLCAILCITPFFLWGSPQTPHTLTMQLKQSQPHYCTDQTLTPQRKQRGNYYILSNFVKASRNFQCDESITLATPADYPFLDNLDALVDRWQGPISVALYVPGDDFKTALKIIAYIRKCQNYLIKELVSFHLFFDSGNVPKEISESNEEITCEKTFDEVLVPSYRSMKNLTFPINVARNVAKEESQTHFVFVSDIELFPNEDFIRDFLSMARRNHFWMDEKRVFVLPVFEVKENESVARNKSELQVMYNEKKMQIFHRKLCVVCHKVPKFESWIKENETDTMEVFTSSKRVGRYKDWEPFFVGTRNIPDFDERFSWEGQSNKMVQGYLMCLLDYDYSVLNNAFLVHKPGIKKKKKQYQEFSKIIYKTQKMMRKVIIPEFKVVYANKTACHL